MVKKRKQDKAWEKNTQLWIREQELRIKECKICAKAARESAGCILEIARLNDLEAKHSLDCLNKGIAQANRYRKKMGLKPLKKRK